MNVYYTYASLQTTGHADLSVISLSLLSLGVDCIVMPQTVNVTTITTQQEAQLAMLDPACENDGNVLVTKIR